MGHWTPLLLNTTLDPLLLNTTLDPPIHLYHHTTVPHPSNPPRSPSKFFSSIILSSASFLSSWLSPPNLHTTQTPSLSSVSHSPFAPHVQSSPTLFSLSSTSRSSPPSSSSHLACSCHSLPSA